MRTSSSLGSAADNLSASDGEPNVRFQRPTASDHAHSSAPDFFCLEDRHFRLSRPYNFVASNWSPVLGRTIERTVF